MDSDSRAKNARARELADWIAGLGYAPDLEPVSDDASFRRYFRIRTGAGEGQSSLIVMDAPPEREDNQAFVHAAALLRAAGLNAPRIHHQDLDRGFLLLTDLGSRSYLDALNDDNADALFSDAIDALIRWQQATQPSALPPYDRARLQAELDLFPDWYVSHHLRVSMTADESHVWRELCELLIESALAQAQVFVHRDYMPRNLMISDPNPGIIDFQDAVIGPISYDLVSLFRDAFLSWEEARVRQWAQRYWQRAQAADLPVPGEFDVFMRAFDWMGAQRHIKVMGIFARLNYRDGKPHYVEDTPRFHNYLAGIGGQYPELRPMLELLASLHERSADR